MYNDKVEHSFRIIQKEIKNKNIKPTIFFIGEEEFLINWAVGILKNKYIEKSMMELDFTIFDEFNFHIEEILNACNSYSMMSSKKIVWVKYEKLLSDKEFVNNNEKNIKKLTDYIQSGNESTILIISARNFDKSIKWIKDVETSAGIYTFPKIERNDLAAFIKKRTDNANVDISSAMISNIIDISGYYNKETTYNLFSLENDLIKLIAHCDGVSINTEDIEASIMGDNEKFVFSLTDAIANLNKNKAISLIYNMLQNGSKEGELLTLILRQMEFLLKVKELSEEGITYNNIAKNLKANEYRVKKNIPYLKKFNISKLNKILVELYDIDIKMKSGQMEWRLSMEMFIGGI